MATASTAINQSSYADRPGSGLSSQVTMGERLLQLADEREHAGNSQ